MADEVALPLLLGINFLLLVLCVRLELKSFERVNWPVYLTCMFEVFWFSMLTISGRGKTVYPSVSNSSLSLLLIRFCFCFICTIIIYKAITVWIHRTRHRLAGIPISSLFLCLTNECFFLFPGLCYCTAALCNVAKRIQKPSQGGNIKKKLGQSSDVYVYVRTYPRRAVIP